MRLRIFSTSTKTKLRSLYSKGSTIWRAKSQPEPTLPRQSAPVTDSSTQSPPILNSISIFYDRLLSSLFAFLCGNNRIPPSSDLRNIDTPPSGSILRNSFLGHHASDQIRWSDIERRIVDLSYTNKKRVGQTRSVHAFKNQKPSIRSLSEVKWLGPSRKRRGFFS